jgi:hypothetical protein
VTTVPDIWQVRDTLDAHIRSWRSVHANGSGNAKVQAPVAISSLQGLRMDLFGDVLHNQEAQ